MRRKILMERNKGSNMVIDRLRKSRRIRKLELSSCLNTSLKADDVLPAPSSANATNSLKRRRRQSETEGEDVSYTLLRSSGGIADWDDYFRDLSAVEWVCPVNFFPHAPLTKQWKEFAISKIGSKIELPHPKSIGELPVYTVAMILAFAGYKALVRFENSGNGPHYVAWISYFSDLPKPLGYSFANNYVVLPVDSIERTGTTDCTGQQRFIEANYSEMDIVSSVNDEHEKVLQEQLADYHDECEFKVNDVVEVMDKEDPVQNRLAVITVIIGDRVQVRYLDEHKGDQGFCFNVKSELVHPLGWSHAIGQNLKGYSNSKGTFPNRTLRKKQLPHVPPNLKIQCGMVFEVRHPFYPFKIATGQVKKKLKLGYFVATIETSNKKDFAEFVFHVTSEYVFPCGFCSEHNIILETPPGEDEDNFTWPNYMEKNQLKPLIKENIHKKRSHSFVKGCKMEAVDIFEPMYFGPATVLDVVEHLLFIHFDGWPRTQDESFQWVSAFSPDIYPVGWAELVNHRFQGHAERPRPTDSFYIQSKLQE